MQSTVRSVFAFCVSSCVLACFSPNEAIDAEDSTGGPSSSSSESGDAVTSGPPTGGGGTTSDNPGLETGPPTESSDPGGSTVTSGTQTGTVSDTDDETTGPGPGCGDGRVDKGEECDEGSENGVSGCTEVCSLVRCGDSLVSVGEVCDDGDENGTSLGACAPDCSKLVDAKSITLSFNYSQNGDLGGSDAVNTVDSRCEAAGLAGYRALFSDGVNRRATVTPYVGDGQIDWVLSPWTRYLRGDGELVWVTDESGLLGVENGMPANLLAPINGTTYVASALTGMRQNWVAYTDNNCFGWTSSAGGSTHRGDPYAESEDFLDDQNPPSGCSSSILLYCVEQ